MAKHFKKKINKDNKIQPGSVVYLNKHKKVIVDGFIINTNFNIIYIRYNGEHNGYKFNFCSRTPDSQWLKIEDLDLSKKNIIAYI